MESTNTEVELKTCSLCLNKNRDVYNVLGRKRDEIKIVLDNFFPLYAGRITTICRYCWQKLDTFSKFKSSVENNLKKRMMTPGKDSTPKRRRPVIEGLLDSIEKLKLSQTGSGKTETSNKSLKPKKQLFAPFDHTYSESIMRETGKVKTDGRNLQAKKEIIAETTAAIAILSTRKISILSTQSAESMMEDDLFHHSLDELSLNVPFLFELLDSLVGDTGNKKGTMAMMYSMILNSRNRQVSALQKLLTVLAVKCHADNKLLSRLNKIHITLSAESKVNVVSAFCEYSQQRVIKAIASGQDGKLNGDNVDIYVTTNDIRMKNKNKDYHFFATDWTPFRLSEEDFEKKEFLQAYIRDHPVVEDANISVELFEANTTQFKENIKYLVARKLIHHFGDHFKWMELVVPDHLQNPLEEIMSRKTTSYCLPILLKNETKYEDCISILDSYEEMMAEYYRKAGRGNDFEKVLIPVGGDQLTRVRLDGAKSLRMGAHTDRERFDNLFPVVVEMFHMQMDFLEKLVKKFMQKATGRDAGTLSHLQILIQRTSVNGNVKSRFKAHEEFVLLCGDAYILEAAMEHFGMEDLVTPPTNHLPPENVDKCHRAKRQAVFDEVMDSFLDTLVGPLKVEDVPDPSTIELAVCGQNMRVPVENGNVNLKLEFKGQKLTAQIPLKSLEENKNVLINLGNQAVVDVHILKNDDLNNYIHNFIQYYFILLNFKDTLAEGDIFRLNNMLKMMIPLFYHHSPLSKYMAECIDYILKTELILPPKLAIQVRVSSFVNPKGKQGKNKAADMQKENQVKELKDLIRGLGSNKTENSIVRLSKAYPVIKDTVSSLDNQLGYKEVKSTHKKRSENEDLEIIIKSLRKLRPFKVVNGRKLNGYPGIHNSVFCTLRPLRVVLEGKILNTACRLKRGLPLYVDESNIEEVEEES